MLYLPTKEELKRKIEVQKRVFETGKHEGLL